MMADERRAQILSIAALETLSAMGLTYDALLADRTALLLQLQGFAAAGEPEVRDAVRAASLRFDDLPPRQPHDKSFLLF